jgi:hypothetical protein
MSGNQFTICQKKEIVFNPCFLLYKMRGNLENDSTAPTSPEISIVKNGYLNCSVQITSRLKQTLRQLGL